MFIYSVAITQRIASNCSDYWLFSFLLPQFLLEEPRKLAADQAHHLVFCLLETVYVAYKETQMFRTEMVPSICVFPCYEYRGQLGSTVCVKFTIPIIIPAENRRFQSGTVGACKRELDD